MAMNEPVISNAERQRNRRGFGLLDRALATAQLGDVEGARVMLTRDWAALWSSHAIPRAIAARHGRVWQELAKLPENCSN